MTLPLLEPHTLAGRRPASSSACASTQGGESAHAAGARSGRSAARKRWEDSPARCDRATAAASDAPAAPPRARSSRRRSSTAPACTGLAQATPRAFVPPTRRVRSKHRPRTKLPRAQAPPPPRPRRPRAPWPSCVQEAARESRFRRGAPADLRQITLPLSVAMAQRWTGGAQQGAEDAAKIKEFESRVDKNDKAQMDLLEEMKAHEAALRRHRQNEDPRLSFSTPEFKEASRIFTENFKARAKTPRAGRSASCNASRHTARKGRSCAASVAARVMRGIRRTGAARGGAAARWAWLLAVDATPPPPRASPAPRRAEKLRQARGVRPGQAVPGARARYEAPARRSAAHWHATADAPASFREGSGSRRC